jgi:pyruvate formate lyase activating enzyme
VAVDPVEKKPLYHWRPGSGILSLGGVGCNLRCPFCQNHPISQVQGGCFPGELTLLSPEQVADLAESNGLRAVAFTYNEPLIHMEYLLEASRVLKARGLGVVLVTNGTVSPDPLAELMGLVDAANVDVKAFSQRGYQSIGGDLQSVLRTVESLFHGGVHVEVTHLVVPNLSVEEEFVQMVRWLRDLSPLIPLHISAYHPAFKAKEPPFPVEHLDRLMELAREMLAYVYVGNVPWRGRNITKCPNCGEDMIVRLGYNMVASYLDVSGNCGSCGFPMGVKV